MYLLAAASSPGLWAPLLALVAGVAFVVAAVTQLRLHPFFALILAAMLVGLLAPELPGDASQSRWFRAVELPLIEFGATASKIALPIALAAVIGICLLESGAADSIVRALLRLTGESLSPLALLAAGFLLSIPVFFDTVFLLLVPLARALAAQLQRRYVVSILAICGGAVLTHSLVAPTPGPLLMADNLDLDLGLTIALGIAAAAVCAIAVYPVSFLLEKWMPVPPPARKKVDGDDAGRPLPGFLISIMPVVIPVLLISAASAAAFLPDATPGGLRALLETAGHRNVALLAGAAVAVHLVVRTTGAGRYALERLLDPPFQTAGVIILITSAGGAFGAMISHAGAARIIESLAAGGGIDLVILAWLVSAGLKAAQGSGTVAMITASAMLAPTLAGNALPGQDLWVYLAIGFGSFALSWMNDSGFWVVARLSEFTETQTLRTWTLLLSTLSLLGLILVFAASRIAALFH
ncbi:MAG TPA: SLC13 family permease [Verrucomicrobiales bacterium]|nr:SLC13 family permease [Verrucomicrobiales bacterium]